MCLTSKISESCKRAWKAKQPDIITAYKIVHVRDVRYVNRPVMKDQYCSPFRWFPSLIIYHKTEENRVAKRPSPIICSVKLDNKKYIPYYHFSESLDDAMRFKKQYWPFGDCDCEGHIEIFECKIKKEDITSIGLQYDTTVIVAKAFKFEKKVG